MPKKLDAATHYRQAKHKPVLVYRGCDVGVDNDTLPSFKNVGCVGKQRFSLRTTKTYLGRGSQPRMMCHVHGTNVTACGGASNTKFAFSLVTLHDLF